MRIFGNEVAPVFGAEHNMDGVVRIGVRHVPRLQRSEILYEPDTHGVPPPPRETARWGPGCPGLPCRRASGAWVMGLSRVFANGWGSISRSPGTCREASQSSP